MKFSKNAYITKILYLNLTFGQKWSTLKSNISKKLIVPIFLAQILKEHERANISEWVSWSGFSGPKQGGGLFLISWQIS